MLTNVTPSEPEYRLRELDRKLGTLKTPPKAPKISADRERCPPDGVATQLEFYEAEQTKG